MNRIHLLAFIATAAVSGTISARLGLVDPPVNLQASSPGTQQAGNINVSATIVAGNVTTSTSDASGVGVKGVATSATGTTYGGSFQANSTTGTAVRGYATALTGVNYGVYGKSVSATGYAGFFEGRLRATGNAIVGGSVTAGSLSIPATQREYVVGALDFANGLSAIENLSNPVLENSTGSVGKILYAPVHLPQGATVISVSSYMIDADTNASAQISLVRRAEDTGSGGDTMASFSSQDEYNRVIDNSINQPVIDNAGFVYFVILSMPPDPTPHTFKVASIHITYTVTEPLP